MKDYEIKDDLGFDIEKAKRCAEYYSRSTEIGTIIIDTHGQILYDYSFGKKNVCTLCNEIKCSKNKQQNCSNTHLLYGSYQAERFGGKYIFFCPLGLVHLASTITANGVMRAAILSGPILMMEPEDFLIDDIIKKNKIKSNYYYELRKQINDTPIISPDRVNSMSELLFIVSEHISDIKPSSYIEEREKLEQQSNISEWLSM